MVRENREQSFDAIERELSAYSDVPASRDATRFVDKPAEGSFTPKVQVVHGSAKDQAAFWAQLEDEAAQSERDIIAAYERKAAQEAGEYLPEVGDAGQFAEYALSADKAAEDGPVEGAKGSPQNEEPLAADESQVENLTLEERYARLMEVVNKKPSHREILIRVLRYCCQMREFSQVEDVIQTYPEYKLAGQNPFRLITFLIDGGGLEQLAVGFDGKEITPEQTEGLTEDEIDDLIECFHLRTTDAGRMVAEEMEPKRRIGNIFSLFADRQQYYSEIMRFCNQPRKFKEIEALFEGRDLSAVRTLHPEAGMAIKPTVFVENLEKAGAIVWKDGWVVTREGEAFLEALGS